MKSSIKVDFVDRGTGKSIEPVIRIESISSEDPRDTLISTLLQSVGGGSYLQLVYATTENTYTRAESYNRILLFKPDIDMNKAMEIVWVCFREWVKTKKYKTLEAHPGDNDVYYQYGNARISKSALFNKFVDEQEIQHPQVAFE